MEIFFPRLSRNHPFPEFRQFDALHPPFLLCSRCALLIYDSAYCSELETQACYVIARRVTRQCTMGVRRMGGGLNSWDSLSKARTNVITKRDEKSARISDLSSNFLENKIRHSITRIDRLISLRPVDCETMLVNCVARIKYISS